MILRLGSSPCELEDYAVEGGDGVGATVEDLADLVAVGYLEIGGDGGVGVVDCRADHLAVVGLVEGNADRSGVGLDLVGIDNVTEEGAVNEMLVRVKRVAAADEHRLEREVGVNHPALALGVLADDGQAAVVGGEDLRADGCRLVAAGAVEAEGLAVEGEGAAFALDAGVGHS